MSQALFDILQILTHLNLNKPMRKFLLLSPFTDEETD